MSDSRQDLSRWYDQGVAQGAMFLLVAVDTYDYDNYPVYAGSVQEAVDELRRLLAASMQDVEEVYDLRGDKTDQMRQRRVWDLDVRR